MKFPVKYSLAFFLLLLTGQTSFGQVKKDSLIQVTPILNLGYLNTSDDSVTLTADISVRRETGVFGLQNAEIGFSVPGTETGKIVTLGKTRAESSGSAVLRISSNSLPVDKEGKVTFNASFAGMGNYLPVSQSVTFKRSKIIVTLIKEDTIKKIGIKAVQFEADNTEKPLKEKVSIYVPRMLSNLKIGEVELDENGTGSLDYPNGLIGDSTGFLTIYAMIEENETFGTVRGAASAQWGIPKHYYAAEKPGRELWTPVAPVWMIITLIIMLTGVWAHYTYAVAQLVMIKILNKREKKKNF